MFLLNSVIVILLFCLSFILPITSFLLPVYKIQKMGRLPRKQKILANLVVMIVITIINPILLAIYLLLYTSIEIFYNTFNKYLPKVKKFDRIVITSLIISIFMGGLIYSFRDELDVVLRLVMDSYQKNMNLTSVEANQILVFMKDNALYFLIDYLMLTNYFVYMSIDARNYRDWEMSFEWLLIYIVPFFMIKVFDIDNFYTQNIKQVGEVIFTFYGIKTIYSSLSKISRIGVLNNFVAFMTAIAFPYTTFVCGVLGSYFYKKEIEKK